MRFPILEVSSYNATVFFSGCLQNIWGMSPINHQRDRYVDFETNCEDVPRDHPAFVGPLGVYKKQDEAHEAEC